MAIQSTVVQQDFPLTTRNCAEKASSTPRLSGVLDALCVGQPHSYGTPDAADAHDKPWTTGFFKRPVDHAIYLGKTNLVGDGQADLKNHGGPDKAVLAYGVENYALWKNDLNIQFTPGAFGENFTIAGLNEQTVCLGDIYAVGKARVEVSQPRQPCWKLARRWRMNELVGMVINNGRSGWYLRVLEEGPVQPGMAVELLERSEPHWPVARAHEVMHHRKNDRALAAALAAVAPLADAWKHQLLARLRRADLKT